MGRQFGPLNPLGLDGETGAPLSGFPHNVQFYAGNYVLECDQLLGTFGGKYFAILWNFKEKIKEKIKKKFFLNFLLLLLVYLTPL